jgi:hypothetical protein
MGTYTNGSNKNITDNVLWWFIVQSTAVAYLLYEILAALSTKLSGLHPSFCNRFANFARWLSANK